MTSDRGIKKGTLQAQLTELAKAGHIPPVLAKASDLLRIIGNVGAHATPHSVHPLLATAIDQFFRAVIEYVYVAPKRLEDFQQQMHRYFDKKA